MCPARLASFFPLPFKYLKILQMIYLRP